MGTGAVIMTVTLLALLFSRLPAFVVILGALAVYLVLTPGINPAIFAQQAITGAESVTLFAIPFLVCAGVLMNYMGVAKRITDFCAVLIGRMYGGLPQVNTLLSTLMGGLSGSAFADAIMEAKMLVPEMEKKGIGRAFSTVVTAASSMIILLIPPGIGLILYSCIANVSIGELFVAGFDPGVLFCAAMMFMASRISKKWGYLPLCTEKVHPSMFWKSFRPAVLLLCLPVTIISGVRSGVFTATEAGSMAIIYAVILGIVYRKLGFEETAQGLKEMLQTTSSIMLIVAAASTFSWILTKEMISQRLTEWMIQMINNKWIFLVAVDIFFIFVGMFVEGNVSVVVLVPLFVSAAAAYGIDPIHFAMAFTSANAIGALTSPMDILMFVTCGATRCLTWDFIKGAAPFYTLLLDCLLTLTFVPLFSTGLVNSVY